jgi:hypothetical protein
MLLPAFVQSTALGEDWKIISEPDDFEAIAPAWQGWEQLKPSAQLDPGYSATAGMYVTN